MKKYKKGLIIGSLSLALIGGLLISSNKSNQALITEETLKSNAKIAIYIKNESGAYEKSNTIPTSGYVLNETDSTCNNNAKPTWNTKTNNLKITNLSKANTSCYLYFDIDTRTDSEKTLANLNLTATPGATEFTGIADTDEGLKSGTDYAGTTYYFRGNVTNNWIKFGKDGDSDIYWRIIRINGDGTIRMIYNGTSTATTGSGTQLGTKEFNTSYDSAEYVGLQYTLGEQRGTGTNSTILGEANSTDATTLYGWYNTKIMGTNYEKYVDTNAVFCSDRDVASGHSSYPGATGTGTTPTMFKPGDRVTMSSGWNTTQAPVMTCSTNNQLRLPVGLITSDEVVFAGGFAGTNNSSYYLHTDKDYWTMSPYNMNSKGYAVAFIVGSSGLLGGNYVYSTTIGVRPVINLRSDVTLKGSGTTTDPYVVEGAE